MLYCFLSFAHCRHVDLKQHGFDAYIDYADRHHANQGYPNNLH